MCAKSTFGAFHLNKNKSSEACFYKWMIFAIRVVDADEGKYKSRVRVRLSRRECLAEIMASSCLCGSLFLGRLNTLSLSLGQTVPVRKSMHPIIRRLLWSNQTSTRQLHRTPEVLRGQMKRDSESYQNSVTFQGSSPRWQLTSLLLPLSHTDDIIWTHGERPRSFQAQFISFYGSNNSVSPKKSQQPRANVRRGAARLLSPHQSLHAVSRNVDGRRW